MVTKNQLAFAMVALVTTALFSACQKSTPESREETQDAPAMIESQSSPAMQTEVSGRDDLDTLTVEADQTVIVEEDFGDLN